MDITGYFVVDSSFLMFVSARSALEDSMDSKSPC